MVGEAMTVGVLYPGEMGAALAGALRARGVRVVTAIAGRSRRTADRCRAAGIVMLDSVLDVIRVSHVTISVVPPGAARDVAAEYCRHAHFAPAGAIYVDANSVAPEVAESLAEELSRQRIDFVDAAINGLAANLSTGGTMFLSGARANEVARLFEGAVRVRVLGTRPGGASAMKMLLSGVSKGLCALFVELALLGTRRSMSAEFLEELSRIYPGVAALIERMLPTYARHAGRRATEMNELEDTARAAGIEPCVIEAVRRLHEALTESIDAGADVNAPTVQSLIEQLAADDFLAGESLTAQQERAI
jgi:3-hydroxyisobutyrate dehydrogenase-like beta-hydroxyacid dehydrogenase